MKSMTGILLSAAVMAVHGSGFGIVMFSSIRCVRSARKKAGLFPQKKFITKSPFQKVAPMQETI